MSASTPDTGLNDVLADKSNVTMTTPMKGELKTPVQDQTPKVDRQTEEQMEVATPANQKSKQTTDGQTEENMEVATPVNQRPIKTARRSSPRTPAGDAMTTPTKSPVKRPAAQAASEENDAAEEEEDGENVSPRKRAAESDVTESQENAIEIKRTRFVRKNSHVPDMPQFTAPVLWNMDAGADASTLHIGEHRCIVGTADGAVLTLDLNGKPIRVQKLPIPIGTLLKDGDFLYAWCPNRYGFQKWKGALYDLTSEHPRMQFEVEDLGETLIHASMHEGFLVLGDDKGSLYMLGSDGEVVWRNESSSEASSKLLFTDETGIYFGHRKKVSKFSLKDGSLIWEHQATGRFAVVQNGAMDEDHIYVEVSGRIIQLLKQDGTLTREYIPARHRASGIAIGNGMLITGSCPTSIFDIKTGEEKYRMNFAGRLQDAEIKLHSRGRLFAAWDKIYCIDVSEEALQRAVTGRSTRTMTMTLDGAICIHAADLIPMTTQSERGILVECVSRNGKCAARTSAEGYDDCWPVEIPVPYRIIGKKFICDKLVPNAKHMFYRPCGDVYELVTTEEMKEAARLQAQENGHAEQPEGAADAPPEDENKNEIHEADEQPEGEAVPNGQHQNDKTEEAKAEEKPEAE